MNSELLQLVKDRDAMVALLEGAIKEVNREFDRRALALKRQTSPTPKKDKPAPAQRPTRTAVEHFNFDGWDAADVEHFKTLRGQKL